MAGEERYNILIVDPNGESRGKLKQVALSLPRFNKVFVASSLAEALAKTDSPDHVDIVVVSRSFGMEAIISFMREAKATRRGKEWAYMAVVRVESQNNETVASGVVDGLDGFLFEPYSADNMREMAEITAAVKNRNEIARRKAAMSMVLVEVIEHLDAVAFYRSKKRDYHIAFRRLEESSERLKRFKEEYAEIYLEALLDAFGGIEAPALTSYHGVSTRVRERLEVRTLEKFDQKYKSED